MRSVRKRVSGLHNQAMSLDRSLDMMKVNSYETLSQEARTSLSLQGHNLLFKTPPTYNLLRVMFGLSVGGHTGSLVDLSTECPEREEDTCTSTDTTDSTSHDDEDVNKTTKLHRTYTKSHSAPDLKSPNLHDSHKEQGDECHDTDFHWVSKDECRDERVNGSKKSREEIDEFFKTLTHPKSAFRQRAWAIKKKKGNRSTSEPAINIPVDDNSEVDTASGETMVDK